MFVSHAVCCKSGIAALLVPHSMKMLQKVAAVIFAAALAHYACVTAQGEAYTSLLHYVHAHSNILVYII